MEIKVRNQSRIAWKCREENMVFALKFRRKIHCNVEILTKMKWKWLWLKWKALEAANKLEAIFAVVCRKANSE